MSINNARDGEIGVLQAVSLHRVREEARGSITFEDVNASR